MADERPQIPDFYAVLGVGFDVSNEELRSAWRTAVKQWHPDRNPSPEAHSRMAQINEAWEVLGNPEQRAEYDTVYFMLRAAIANAERERQEEERLERERRERLRQQEMERKMREEEAARRRVIEEEERRAEQARREKERQERARRKAEQERIEQARREKERQERARRDREERRERERIEKERREQEREERLPQRREEVDRKRRERGEPAGPPGGTDYGRSAGPGNRPVAWIFGFVALAALIVVVAVFVVNWINEQNESDNTVAQVAPTPRVVRGTATPRIVYVRATPGPTDRIIYVTASPRTTSFPTPTASVDRTRREYGLNSETWRATPATTMVSATATPTPLPTPTPDPDLEWLDSIQPGSVHEYLLISDNPTGAEVTRMIAAGAEFGYIDDIGFGSLFLAVVTGAGPDVVTTLIDAGDDISQNPQLLHALMWSDNPTVEVARVLINAGADLLHTDHNGQIPLDIAIERAEIPDAVYVMIRDATEATVEQVRVVATPTNTPTTVPSPTATAVPTATPSATPTPEPTVTPVPTATPAPTPTPTPTITPTATASPTPTVTPTLEPNEVATKSLWSALKRTSRPGQDEVGYLIGLGADVTELDTSGRTMFEYALGLGYDFTIVRLLSAGLSVEAATRSLWFILTGNVSPPRSDVEFLINLGADISVLDSRGRTMFEYAVGRGFNVEVLELFEAAVHIQRPKPVSTATPTPRSSHVLVHRGSGTIYSDHDDGVIACPSSTSAPAYLSSDAISGEVSFSFEVPSARSWSIGLVYHDRPDDSLTLTATFVHRPPNSPVEAWHVTRVGEQVVDDIEPVVISPQIIDQSVGALNTVTIATSELGSQLVVNDSLVLEVPRSDLRPARGSMRVCVGIRKVEQRDYLIDYIDLRAWTE